MATQLKLYNGALFLLKATRLATVSDEREERYTLDEIYADTLIHCLEEANWKFATRSVAIEHDAAQDPSFGFSYAFEQPSDFVRLVAISGNGEFDPPLEMFGDEAQYWHANVDPIYVSYVSDDSSYGGDLSLWPASYQRAVEYALAMQIAPHITTMGGEALAMLQKGATRAMAEAKSKDARRGPVLRPPAGRLVRARSFGTDSFRREV